MTPKPQPSSESDWVTIKDGSDREWRLISMYELKQLEHAINEECVGKNDGCPPGHLKEMHDLGNSVIDKVRSRSNATTIRTTSELPVIIPPPPKGDTKDLKVWKEYWEQHDAVIRQDEREKVLDELRIVKEYDRIRFHQKHTLPKSWVEVKVTSVSKDGKRIGISGKMPGDGCTTQMGIDQSDVRSVCRWIELRTPTPEAHR